MLKKLYSYFIEEPRRKKQEEKVRLHEESVKWQKGYEAYKKGISCSDSNDLENALHHLDIAVNYDIPKAYSERASVLMSLNFCTEAIADWDNAIDYEPSDANLYYCRAHCKRWTGDFEGARIDYQNAVAFSKLHSPTNIRRDKKFQEKGAESAIHIYMAYQQSNELDYISYLEEEEEMRKYGEEAGVLHKIIKRNLENRREQKKGVISTSGLDAWWKSLPPKQRVKLAREHITKNALHNVQNKSK